MNNLFKMCDEDVEDRVSDDNANRIRCTYIDSDLSLINKLSKSDNISADVDDWLYGDDDNKRAIFFILAEYENLVLLDKLTLFLYNNPYYYAHILIGAAKQSNYAVLTWLFNNNLNYPYTAIVLANHYAMMEKNMQLVEYLEYCLNTKIFKHKSVDNRFEISIKNSISILQTDNTIIISHIRSFCKLKINKLMKR